MTWEERLDLISYIAERASATGNTEALAKANDLLGQLLELRGGGASVTPNEADPMTRARTREDGRRADGLRKLRKGRDECTATRRDGQPCRAPAIEGGLVCPRHGGAAPQVQIKAGHTRLLEAAYFAHLDWQEARGTPGEFDALCKALRAQRALDAYEAKLGQLAGLRAELRRQRAHGTMRTS